MWPSAYSTSAAAAAAGALPQTLQRRLVRFLIRRTLGHLLRGADVDLDAVDVQLGRGVVELRDLALDESSLNALLAGVPVAVVRGHLARVTVRLPWASFSRVDHDDDDGSSATSSRCEVELDGLELDAVALADLPGTECDDEDSAAASLHEQLKSSFITGADPLSTSVYSAFDAADAFHHDDPMVAEDLDCIEDDEGVRMLASIIDHFVGAIHVRVCNTVIQVHRELSDKDTCDSWIIRVPCISYKDTTDSGSSGATLKSIAPESITLSLKDAGGTESPIAQFAECQIRVEALEQGDRADRREHRINVTASVKRLIACVMPESMVKFASFIDALQRSVELSNAYERETRTAAATQNDRQFDGKWEAMTVDIFVISQQAAIDPRSFFQELNATAEHDKHGRLDDFAKLIGADHIKLSAEHVLMHLGSRKPPELKVFALSMAEYLTSKTRPNVFLDQSSTTTPCDQFTNIVEFTAEHHQPDLRLAVHNGDTCLTLAPVKINLDPCVMRRYGEYIEVFGDVTTTGRMGLAAIRVDVPRVRLSLAVPVIGVEGVLCDKMQEYTDRLAVHTENLHAEVRNGRIDIVADTIRCFLETRKDEQTLVTVCSLQESLNDPVRSPHVSLVFNESGNEDPLTTPQFNSIEHTLNFFEAIKRTASCAVRLEFPLVGFTCDKPFFDRTRVLLTQLSSWTQTWKQQRERPQTQPLQTSVALSIDIGKLTASVALEDVSYGLDVLNARVLLGLRLGGLAGHNFVFSETRDLMFVDSSSDKPRSILSTTVPHFEVLDDRQQQPVTVVATGFFTLDPVLCTSQSDVRITLSNITWHYEAQSTWMQDLFTLIGGSELSTPHSSRFDRLMKLEVNARELSIDYRPSCLPTCAELIVETGQLSTTLIAHIPTTTIHLSMPRARILLMDSDLSMLPLDAAYGLVHDRYVALKYWTTLGFVDVATFNDLEVDIRTLLGISQVHGIDVRCRQVDVTTCADSYVTLRDFLGYVLGGNVDEEISHQDIASQISSDNVDVLQGLDEDAFGSGSMVNAEMPVEEMKDDDDDIITMLDISGLTIVDDYFSVSTSISQAKPVDDPPSELSWERIGSPIKEFDGTNPDDIVRVFDATIAINPHHFTVAGTGHHRTILPSSRFKLQISWSIDWHLFGGFDWRSNQELAAEKAERRRRKRAGAAHLSAEDTSIDEPAVEIFYDIDEESVSFTEESRSDESLFHMEMEDATSRRPTTPNTGHIPASTTARSKTSASESCSILPAYFKRSSTNQMQIRLHSFDIAYDSFEEGDQLSSRLVMSANDVEIIDDISTSTWRKFLTVPKPDFNDPRTARQTGSKDVRLEICHVHPQLGSKETEARVKLHVLPVRMHVDQDALDHILNFFSFEPPSVEDNAERHKTKSPTFIQNCHVQETHIKVDFKPKRVNFSRLNAGNYVELLNLFHLDGAEFAFPEQRLSGISGYGKLTSAIVQAWMPQLTGRQLPSMIAGLTPIRSAITIGSGIADLVLLPVEQFHRDGRVIRGMQRGTNRFVKTAAMEALKVGSRMAAGAQVILEGVDEFLGGAASPRPHVHTTGSTVVSKYAEQPTSFSEGLSAAIGSLSLNLGHAAETIIAVPTEVSERGSFAPVIKAIPVAVLRPLIGTSEALRNAFLGIRNSIDAQQRVQMDDKYKRRRDSSLGKRRQ